jgi:hypothetical protein
MMLVRIVVVTAAVLFLAACASQPVVSNDAPSGTWSGDYGADSARRDPIRVELRWEDRNLRGVVQAGFRGLPITTASYKPETGAISIEFDAEGNGGRKVHYVIDGKVSGNTMTGTWTHDDQRGDFRVTKE